MLTRSCVVVACIATVAATGSVKAAIVQVQINGTVAFNAFTSQPLAGVHANDAAKITFLVDSNNFVNSPSFPTRGYAIDKTSFMFTMGAVTIGLENPYPAGQTPFFVLRNNDPAVDGFLISESVDQPAGVDTSVNNVNLAFLATYGPNLLSSLNILDAVGTYNLAGLTVFNWTLDVGPSSPLEVNYQSMTISVVPTPATLAVFMSALALGGRRRRTS